MSSLRRRLAEAEETLRAIRDGEVDAVIVKGTKGEQVYSLSGAETIYRQAAETMAEAVAAFSPDGRIVFANARLSELLGIPHEHILGHRFEEIVQPEDRPRLAAMVRRAEAIPARERLLMTDSRARPRPALVSISVSHTSDGVVFTAVAMDMTDIERIAESLARARADRQNLQEDILRLQNTLANAAVGLAITTTSGRFAEVNEAFCRLLGYSERELGGLTHDELIHPDDRTESARLAAHLLAGDTASFVVENRYVRKDGLPVWVRRSVSRVRDSSDNEQGHVAFVEDISEQKRAEAALRETRDKYQALIESSSDFVWEMDAQGRYTYCSPQMEKLWGLKPEEMIGRTPFDQTPAALRTLVEAGFRGLAEHPKPFAGLVIEALDAAGQRIFIEIGGVPFFDDGGKLLGFRGMSRDITERKRADEALRDSEALLRSLTDNITDAVYIKDTQSRWLMANPAVLHIVNKTAEQALGRTDAELYADPEIGRAILEHDRRVLERGQSETFEETADTPEGRRQFLSTKAPRRDAQGNIAGIVGISHDITQRKEAERALRESEEKANALIKYAPTGIYEIDLRGRRFLSVNDAMCRTLGYTREELMAIGPMDVLDEDSRARFAERVRRTIAGEQVDEAVEYQVLRKDGTTIDAVLYVTFGPDGSRALVVAHDVTERRQAERKLRETLAELKRSNEELEQFAYVASHDLQEPLRMVSNYVDLLRQRYRTKLDGQADKYIDYASGGARRMQALISDLLMFSRVGRREMKAELVNLNHVFRKALYNLETATGETGAAITSGTLPTVVGDELALLQVFQNLIDNGIKFRGKEPPAVRVDAETRGHGDAGTRRRGDTGTRRRGDTGTRRHGDTETRRRGSLLSAFPTTALESSPATPRRSSACSSACTRWTSTPARASASPSASAWSSATAGGYGSSPCRVRVRRSFSRCPGTGWTSASVPPRILSR